MAKLQFSVVIGTTSECEADEFKITAKLREYMDREFSGKVFIKNIFLDKRKEKRLHTEAEKT